MPSDPIRETTIDAKEIARLERARAVAARAALREAAAMVDGMKEQIERSNPGRRRGSVSQVGQFGADAMKCASDAIWSMRDGIKVP